jgi:hypothetical protein
MTTGGYVEAIASERASLQQQVDDIQRAYNRQQKTGGDTRLLITRDQALSDAKTNHAVECAAIIAQAYHNGDYNGFWQALSEATRIDLFCFTEPLIDRIVRHTITLTGLYDRHINEASLHVEQFTDTIIRDAPTAPSVGAYLLYNHLYDEGNARALAVNNASFVAASNAITVGNRIVKEIANGGEPDDIGFHQVNLRQLTVLAHLAGVSNHGRTLLAQLGGKMFRLAAAGAPTLVSADYGLIHEMCGSVHDAAAQWRTAIDTAEKDNNKSREIEARCAHMKLCGALMEHGSLPAADLAALIDTFQSTRLMQVQPPGYVIMTRELIISARDARGNATTKIKITNVEELLDAAASRTETYRN